MKEKKKKESNTEIKKEKKKEGRKNKAIYKNTKNRDNINKKT